MDKVMLKSHSNPNIGMAVFASGDIQPNEIVIESIPVETISKRNKYSLEIDGNHVLINKPGILVNHSCSPNCKLEVNDYGGFNFISLKEIYREEEITFDYESNESQVSSFTECHCNSKLCRKIMNSKKQL